MLCPNEVGCSFTHTIYPPRNESTHLYEQLDGVFLKGDICSFKIALPPGSDPNDVLYLRTEHFKLTTAKLIKGKSLQEPKAMYSLSPG